MGGGSSSVSRVCHRAPEALVSEMKRRLPGRFESLMIIK